MVADVHFEKIYRQSVALVQFTLSTFGLQKEIEMEIIQETFLKLHKARATVELSKANQFLVLSAKNLAIDTLRRLKTRKTDPTDPEDLGSETLWKTDRRRLAEIALAEEFVEKIRNMPGGECFGLFYFDGLSIQEISARLGESRGTITSRLTRLRQRFKDEIKNEIADIDGDFS